MKEEIFEGETYKEFQTVEEGNDWGWKFFSDILVPSKDNNAYLSVFCYTGSMFCKWNKVLRKYPAIESGLFEECDKREFSEDGEQICRIKEVNSLLRQHNIPENIIVYRYTKKKHIKDLCSSHFFRNGLRFFDKAFLSTTLISELLYDFAKTKEYDCLLKIYVPKGTQGAYVSLKNPLSKLNEQEVLLAPNLMLEIVKVHHRLKKTILIECRVVNDE